MALLSSSLLAVNVRLHAMCRTRSIWRYCHRTNTYQSWSLADFVQWGGYWSALAFSEKLLYSREWYQRYEFCWSNQNVVRCPLLERKAPPLSVWRRQVLKNSGLRSCPCLVHQLRLQDKWNWLEVRQSVTWTKGPSQNAWTRMHVILLSSQSSCAIRRDDNRDVSLSSIWLSSSTDGKERNQCSRSVSHERCSVRDAVRLSSGSRPPRRSHLLAR